MNIKPLVLKYKKNHKSALKRFEGKKKRFLPGVGKSSLISLETGLLRTNQLRAAVRIMAKRIKKTNKFWCFLYPDRSVCKKKKGVRMGSGKGKPFSWVSAVAYGSVIFEIGFGFSREKTLKIFREVSGKLGIKTRVCVFFN